MRKVGAFLAFFSGLYGVLASAVTLFVLGGIGSAPSVDPAGVSIAWLGVALSLAICCLSLICFRRDGRKPLVLLLLTAFLGFWISGMLVSFFMVAAFVSGLLASYGFLPAVSKKLLVALHLQLPRISQDESKTTNLTVPERSAAS